MSCESRQEAEEWAAAIANNVRALPEPEGKIVVQTVCVLLLYVALDVLYLSFFYVFCADHLLVACMLQRAQAATPI